MLRQAVAAFPRTALRAAPRATSQVVRPQAYAAAAPALRSFQPAASRWYSDAKEEKTEKAEASEDKGATDEVSELKKSLEAKDAEAREWKVGTPAT